LLSSEDRHQNRAIIKEGDDVLIYIDERRYRVVRVRKNEYFNSDKGSLNLGNVIGKEWGDEVKLSTGSKALIMRPLIIDYFERGLKRVTQVIYPKDLGLMLILGNVATGSKVLEGGVGTGFLTITLARVVGDEGHVYAYEIRKEFIDAAISNLKRLGLENRVTIRHGDVRKDVKESNLDAAFLDIPDPWNALDTLRKALKPTSPVIVFLPTANQVIKLLKVLSDKRVATDVHIYETMLREYIPDHEALRPKTTMIAHTGYVIFFRILK